MNFLFLLLLLLPTVSNAYTHNKLSHQKRTQKNALLVGLCASAAYLLSKWFFSAKDQDLVILAQKVIESIAAKYHDILNIIDQHYFFTLDMQYSEAIIHRASEQAVYDIACYLRQKNESRNDMQRSLLPEINQLSTLLHSLDTQAQQWEVQEYYSTEQEETMYHVKNFMYHIVLLREKLKYLRRCITEHENYFVLFDVEAYIKNTYQIPLEQSTLHQHDQKRMQQLLRDWALSADATIQSIPQMVKKIQSDILLLKKTIVDTNPDYIHRIRAAKQLADSLILIKTYLTIDPLYSVETAAHAWETLSAEYAHKSCIL